MRTHMAGSMACTADTKGMSKEDALRYAKSQVEFAGEEGREYREAWAQKMHTKNLHEVTKYLHRKGVWRVQLNRTCEIMAIVGGTKGGPPVAGEFSFKCAANGEKPTFGSLHRLDDAQTKYAKTLIDDLEKVSRARELAYQHKQAAEAEGTGALVEPILKDYLDGFTEKAGELPVSKSAVQDEQRRQATLEAQQQAERRRREEETALRELGVSGGDGGLSDVSDAIERDRQKARKKAQKAARQKAKKAAAKAELDAEATAAAVEAAERQLVDVV